MGASYTSWATDWPLLWIVGLFGFAGLLIVVVGTRLTGVVDQLADRTRLGEAIAGGIFLGATTSLPDIVVSTMAAATGHPEIAVTNALGGIAVQTVFLAVADLTYRRANLEHAAASMTNMIQATLLIVLLAAPMLAMSTPGVSFLGVHPVTPAIFIVYVLCQRMIVRHRDNPGWHPQQTAETVEDEVEAERSKYSTGALWGQFVVTALIVVGAGYLVAETGVALAETTGLSGSAVGAVMTGVVTSLGELVTSIAAVRRGALTLAVGGIIGGNAFDALLVPLSDVAYRDGSIFHAIGDAPIFVAAVTIIMTAVLLMGLLRREMKGVGNIGFEGCIILALYAGTAVTLLVL